MAGIRLYTLNDEEFLNLFDAFSEFQNIRIRRSRSDHMYANITTDLLCSVFVDGADFTQLIQRAERSISAEELKRRLSAVLGRGQT